MERSLSDALKLHINVQTDRSTVHFNPLSSFLHSSYPILSFIKINDTAGPKWFDLPATTVTPELKQELRLLQVRWERERGGSERERQRE